LPAVPARISTTNTLRDDPLKAHLACLGEHERSVLYQRIAEHQAVNAGDEREKRPSPFLDRLRTEIFAVKVQKIERDETGPR
jgi:hypothetical protein